MSSNGASSSAQKYNVRERRSQMHIANGSSATSESKDPFTVATDGSALERDEPIARDPAVLSYRKSENSPVVVPQTPTDRFRKLNLDTPSTRNKSSSESPSHAKSTRRQMGKAITQSSNAKAMKDWREKPASGVDSPKASSSDENSYAIADGDVVDRRVPEGVVVNNDNAQKYYAREDCLFVANLNNSLSHIENQAELEKAFSAFGTVYVKVNQDLKRNPMAFIQFTSHAHAEAAKAALEGSNFSGRAIRIEWSDANCDYVLTRHDNQPVTEDDARGLLRYYGVISEIVPASTFFSFGEFIKGVVVKFLSYQSGREACRDLHGSDEWRLVAYDKKVATKQHFSGTGMRLNDTPRDVRAKASIRDYETDRNSVWVGNLERHVGEKDLRELFSGIGRVVSVSIQVRDSRIQGGCENVFAYVQFTNPDEVQAAIAARHSSLFRGKQIKVQQKESDDKLSAKRGMGSLSRNGGGRPTATPTRGTFPSWNQSIQSPYQAPPPYGLGPMGLFGQGQASSPYGYGSPAFGYPGSGTPGYAAAHHAHFNQGAYAPSPLAQNFPAVVPGAASPAPYYSPGLVLTDSGTAYGPNAPNAPPASPSPMLVGTPQAPQQGTPTSLLAPPPVFNGSGRLAPQHAVGYDLNGHSWAYHNGANAHQHGGVPLSEPRYGNVAGMGPPKEKVDAKLQTYDVFNAASIAADAPAPAAAVDDVGEAEGGGVKIQVENTSS